MVFAAESQGGTSFKAMSLEMSVSMPRPASTGFPVFWGQETHLIILDPRAGPQMLQDDKVKKGQGIDHFPPDHIYIYIYIQAKTPISTTLKTMSTVVQCVKMFRKDSIRWGVTHRRSMSCKLS